ncbi:MAG: MucR family transcriptional regulator [Mesorhizobium sp.]|nr:MucR family transcriptional regulator [Mesorhizobium sp.]MBL8578338.1 MucR family transcriptional regulator [Mesorhizobium sp.]
MGDIEKDELIALTAGIVSAYVARNRLPPTEVAGLIASVSETIQKLGQPEPAPEPELVPAVNPKRSIHPGHIVCLEDGKKFKSMKRHLASHGLTPQQYRSKWRLPADYPMTAPNYSATRSAMARDVGLGRTPVARKPRRKKAS